MSRTAVFVDAGYLYAAGAIILTGSSQNRNASTLDHHSALERLRATCDQLTGGAPILRFYWYDGLLRGRPSPEQEAVANTDNVKLRLGSVVGGQQKGVDSLIIMDLIELARNHAISEAVLLSGDEDLRVGVQLAQSFGVRVHLLGVEPTRGNQSYLLLQEADTTTEWNKDVVETIMSVKPYVESYLDSLNGPVTLGLGEGGGRGAGPRGVGGGRIHRRRRTGDYSGGAVTRPALGAAGLGPPATAPRLRDA